MRIVSRHHDSVPVARPNRKKIHTVLRTWFIQRFPPFWVGIVLFLIGLDVFASISATTQRWEDIYQPGIFLNIVVIAIACALSALVARVDTARWLRAMLTLAILPLPILAVTSGNIATLCIAIALLSPLVWLGRVLTSFLLRDCSQLEAWAIGGAFGIVGVGIIGFVLGLAHALRWVFIAPILGIVFVALLCLAREQLRGDIVALTKALGRPRTLNPLSIILAALLLGCIWLNIPGALAPEIRSDAIRQRLVTAVHFADQGTLTPDDPDLSVAKDTAFGEIAYAVPIALGSVQAAKLLHWFAGIVGIIAIFALGRRLGGDLAGLMAAVAFYATLLVAYLSQTAYLDLLLTLFAVTAALCLLVGNGSSTGAIVGAGIVLGAGVMTKAPFGYIAIGLALTSAILAWPGGWRRSIRHLATLSTTSIALALPWMIRSVLLTKTFLIYGYVHTAATDYSQLGDLPSFGFGRSPLQLLIAPLTTTFLSVRFGGIQLGSVPIWGGHIGFLPFFLLPFLFFVRQHRQFFALAVGAIPMTVLWFYTAQHVRYLLPILALSCVLGATGYVVIWRQITSKTLRIGLNIAVVLIAVMGVFARVQLPATAQLYALGLQSRAEYLSRWLYLDNAASYETLTLLNSEPSATRVFAYQDGARLYSNVRISNGVEQDFLGTDSQILAALQRGGYSHILIDRSSWVNNSWDLIKVIDEGFLRRNTVLVGGDHGSYLYRILPEEQRDRNAWTQGAEMLTAQQFVGVSHDLQSPDGAPIQLASATPLTATVPLAAGGQYLLATNVRSVEHYGTVQIRVSWRDHQDNILVTTKESYPASPLQAHIFSTLVSAPAGAVGATISVTAGGSEKIWLDSISLRATPAVAFPEHAP